MPSNNGDGDNGGGRHHIHGGTESSPPRSVVLNKRKTAVRTTTTHNGGVMHQSINFVCVRAFRIEHFLPALKDKGFQNEDEVQRTVELDFAVGQAVLPFTS